METNEISFLEGKVFINGNEIKQVSGIKIISDFQNISEVEIKLNAKIKDLDVDLSSLK